MSNPTLNDERDEPPKVIVPKAYRRRMLILYFRRYVWWFAAGGVALVATNLMSLEIPARMGQAIELLRDKLQSPEPAALAQVSDQLAWASAMIIILAVGAMIARILSRIFIFSAGRFIEFDARNELYAKLTELDPSYYQQTPTGDVTSRVTNDVSYIRLLYALTFLHVINTALAYGIAMRKMIILDWALTLWCLAPYPFLILALRAVTTRLFEQTKRVQAQMSTLSSRVQENLSGMTVVKTFNLQDRERQSFDQLSHEYYRENMKLAIYRGALNALMVIAAGLGTVIVLWVGADLVWQDKMELGQFIEFNGYVVSLAFPTVAMGWVFSVWHRGQAAFDRVLEVLVKESELKEPEQPMTLPQREDRQDRQLGQLSLKEVSFSYPGTQSVALKEISLQIEPGSKVAIVGKTGSGKSTLARLLSRQYDPSQGHISLDGVDLTQLRLRALRAELGVVPQDPFLFSMTLEQNLRFGLDGFEHDPSLDRALPTRSLLDPSQTGLSQAERIQQAITIAGLEQDLEALPKGLETMVGERGVTLSGGQKQRVTIARALLMDPRVLLLDDALSSVDAQTEAKILDHLEQIMQGRTTILITHRYNALGRMDLVLVMDEGRLVERGTHEELLAQGGLYTQMVEQQKLRERLES